MCKNKISVGISDDYATAYVCDKNYNDIVSIYYGYEVTHCPKHETEDECDENDCDKREWCFSLLDSNGNKVKMMTSILEAESDDLDRGMERYVLAGIAKLLKDGVLVLDEEKLKNYPDNLHKSK